MKNLDYANKIINYGNGSFISEINNQSGGNDIINKKKSNENNLMLFKNEDLNDLIEKRNATNLMIMNILNKKPATILNIKKINFISLEDSKSNGKINVELGK